MRPFGRHKIDLTGVAVLYRCENGTTSYRLQDGEDRREFTIEHNYAGERRLIGCSGISRFVTAFEAARSPFLMEGERSWVWLTREDGWITRSHDRTLRKVLRSAREDIANVRFRHELEAAGMDARINARRAASR